MPSDRMRWALIAHLGQFIRGKLVQTPIHIAEAAIPTAVAQEWIVLARDSDLEPAAPVNVQSNPRRIDAPPAQRQEP